MKMMEVNFLVNYIQTTWKLGEGRLIKKKTEKEDGMDSGQPTIMSPLVARHQTNAGLREH